MNNKRIVKNYLYNIGYETLILILPVITAPYIARGLGADGIGSSDYSSSFALMFSAFGRFGIEKYGSKHIAYNRDNKEKMSKTFWDIWFLQVIFSLLSTIAYIIFLTFQGSSLRILFILQLPIVLSSLISISWFYIGIENFKKIVIRNTFIRAISVIAIFTLVKSYSDLNIYILINSLSALLGGITFWISIPKYVNIFKFSDIEIRPHIRETFIYFIPQICIQLYTVGDKIIIGALTSVTNVGYYSQSLRIPKMSLAFITSLSTVLMPKIANLYRKSDMKNIEKYLKKSLQITICIGIFGASSMAAVSSKFVPIFFGEDFNVIIPYMMVTSLIAIIIPIGLVFTNQFTIPTSKNREYVIPIILAAIMSVISNLILIPIIGIIGGIISVILTELTCTSLKIILVRKYLDLKELFRKTYIYFFFGSINFIVVYLSSSIIKTNIITLILMCGLCFLVYGVLILVFNNPIRTDILNLVKKKA
ncbi:oligosaccharide flippase family protein [Clostridium sp.]|uniref:oligosaccharide flippase family protein n=1 Tax=Clostridium sp. TaxID=1506 RepID=UPI0026109D14|nr:oligosaccharide flippase family protein [Clostridium sp.]